MAKRYGLRLGLPYLYNDKYAQSLVEKKKKHIAGARPRHDICLQSSAGNGKPGCFKSKPSISDISSLST